MGTRILNKSDFITHNDCAPTSNRERHMIFAGLNSKTEVEQTLELEDKNVDQLIDDQKKAEQKAVEKQASQPKEKKRNSIYGLELMNLCLENNSGSQEVQDAYTKAYVAQLPKRIKIKPPKNKQNGIPQLDYYEHKRPDQNILLNPNPATIKNYDEYMGQVRPMLHLYNRQDGIYKIVKGKMVKGEDFGAGKFTTMSGSHVVSQMSGLSVEQYEFCQKSYPNFLVALSRLLSAKQQPDPKHVGKFRVMCKLFFTQLGDKINREEADTDILA